MTRKISKILTVLLLDSCWSSCKLSVLLKLKESAVSFLISASFSSVIVLKMVRWQHDLGNQFHSRKVHMYLNCNGWSVKAGGADLGGGSTKSSLLTSICNFDTPSMHESEAHPWLWDFLYSCDFWKSLRTVVFYQIINERYIILKQWK